MKHTTPFSERTVARYYLDGDLNCAEAVLYGSNEHYGLGLDTQGLLLSAGFGGGMGIESVCGALTGSLMALGILYVKERAHEGEVMKQLAQDFLQEFASRHGTIMCSDLKKAHFDEEKRCSAVVRMAADLLESFIEEKQKLRVR